MANTWTSPRLLSFADRFEIVYAEISLQADSHHTVLMKECLAIMGEKVKGELESFLSSIHAYDKQTKRISLSVFTLQQFIAFQTHALDCSDVQEEFSSLTGGAEHLTAAKLREVLVMHQRDVRANEILDPEPTLEDCSAIISAFEPSPALREKRLLSETGFQAYLLSKQNDIVSPKHRSVYQDMTKPLAHYFISSSHNTYLTAG
jgi:hypothetical protein